MLMVDLKYGLKYGLRFQNSEIGATCRLLHLQVVVGMAKFSPEPMARAPN